MSDELGQANFIWETTSCVFSNSDNLGGSDDMKGKTPLLNSSTPITTLTPTVTPTTTPSTPVRDPKQSRSRVTNKEKGGEAGSVGGVESDHEIHIWTERERRKKMRNMFSSLHDLLPHLPLKADKSTIVDETVSYIKTLQNTLQKLQKQKLERLGEALTDINYGPSWATPNMLRYNSTREAYLSEQVSSTDLFMSTNLSNSPLNMPRVSTSLQTWSSPNVVLNLCGEDAQISVCAPKKPGIFTTIVCVLEKHRIDVITAQISSDFHKNMFMIHAHVSGISGHFQRMLTTEEIFKLAVGEIIYWIST